jgi:lipopolysaccharide export system protein LptA
MRRGAPLFAASTGLAVLLLCSGASAQQAATQPSGFGGFGAADRGPIQIEAQELEVRDKEGVAIFSGRVVVTQGRTVLETPRLVVHYAAGAGAGGGSQKKDADKTASADGATPPASQDIDRLDADGPVIVTSGDQSATGDKAAYDARAQQLELLGNVILTQGKNVVRGDKLTVDLATGVAKVASTGRRVQMLLTPNAGGKTN